MKDHKKENSAILPLSFVFRIVQLVKDQKDLYSIACSSTYGRDAIIKGRTRLTLRLENFGFEKEDVGKNHLQNDEVIIASLQQFSQLQHLIINPCERENLEFLQSLTSLRQLDLNLTHRDDNSIGVNLEPLQLLTNLVSLKLRLNYNFAFISPLKKLTRLRNVNLQYSYRSLDLNSLSQMSQLAHLQLNAPIQNLQSISDMTQVETLDLTHCNNIRPLNTLAGGDHGIFSNLTTLHLGRSYVNDLSPLALCTKIKVLTLGYNEHIRDLSALSSLVYLEELYLAFCTKIVSLFPLQGLSRMRILDISQCNSINYTDPLRYLTTLYRLDMYQNPQFAKCDVLNSLINFENLRLLDISSWQEIYEDDLSAFVSQLVNLEQLNMSYTWQFEKPLALHTFDKLVKLKKLRLDSCRIGHVFPNEGCDHISEMVPTKMFKKAVNIPNFNNLANLIMLDLQGNPDFTDLSVLSNLTQLTWLDIGGCVNIKDLFPISRLKRLGSLSLAGITLVEDFSPLVRLSKLKIIYVNTENQDVLSSIDSESGHSHTFEETKFSDKSTDVGGALIHVLSRLPLLTSIYFDECLYFPDLQPLCSTKLTTLCMSRFFIHLDKLKLTASEYVKLIPREKNGRILSKNVFDC